MELNIIIIFTLFILHKNITQKICYLNEKKSINMYRECNATKMRVRRHLEMRGRALPRVADIFSPRPLLGTDGRIRLR